MHRTGSKREGSITRAFECTRCGSTYASRQSLSTHYYDRYCTQSVKRRTIRRDQSSHLFPRSGNNIVPSFAVDCVVPIPDNSTIRREEPLVDPDYFLRQLWRKATGNVTCADEFAPTREPTFGKNNTVIFSHQEMDIARATVSLSQPIADAMLAWQTAVRFKTKQELENILCGTDSSWKTIAIDDPSDGQELLLRMADCPVEELRALVEQKLPRDAVLNLKPEARYNTAGIRKYESAHDGSAWIEASAKVCAEFGEDALTVPYMLWSDKSPIVLGKESFWQVVMVCPAYDINTMRLKMSYRRIALLPVVKLSDTLFKKNDLRIRRREILHKALTLVFEKLKAVQFTGVRWQPCGHQKSLCVPHLLAYPVDHEEAWDLACLLHNGEHPDLRTLVVQDQLDDTETYFVPERKSKVMTRAIDLAQRARTTGDLGCICAAYELLTDYSAVPVTSALLGFRWSDALTTITITDTDHQDNSGVGLKLLLQVVETCTDGELDQINKRIRLLSRISGTKLPSNVSKVGAGNVTCSERGNLVCIMPYVLKGMWGGNNFENGLISCFVLYNEWRTTRDLSLHDDNTLAELKTARIVCQKEIKKTFPNCSWKFPKFFNMRWYETIIPLLGPTWIYCVGYLERTNKDMKWAVGRRLTNTKNM